MPSKFVTIVLTNACNLNCVYCYETNKSRDKMNESMALDIVNKEMMCNDCDEVVFNLFGGEPFLEFDLIKSICYFLETYFSERKWQIEIITNGTLIHGDVQKWLEDKKNRVTCTLSLDGLPDVHDKNRSNSFEDIDIDFFRGLYSTPYAKMTISQYVLGNLASNIIFIQQEGFSVNCTLGYGMDWTEGDYIILDRELKKYYKYAFDKGLTFDSCSLLRFPFREIFFSKDKYYRNCDVGSHAKSFYVNGKNYPCHMLMPNGLDEKQLQEISNIVFPDLIVKDENVDFLCKKCPIYTVCQFCYANNYKVNGNIYLQDIKICKANKVIFKNKAEYFVKMWEKMDWTKEDEYMLLDSLSRIALLDNED